MKLTNAIRESICDALVNRALGARRADLVRERAVLGIDILRRHIIKPEHLELIDSLPDGLVGTTEYITVYVDSVCTHLNLRDRFKIPAYASKHVSLGPGSEFEVRVQAVRDLAKVLGEEEQVIRVQSSAILASCSTDKALWAAWPEVRPVAEPLFPVAVKKPYPVAVPGSLNSALGLPVEVVG